MSTPTLTELVKDARSYLVCVDKQLAKIETRLKNDSLDPAKAITDIRQMGSMQMIEEIINARNDRTKNNRPSSKTFKFILGLRDSYNQFGHLTESQRFHLETTMSSFRNNSES